MRLKWWLTRGEIIPDLRLGVCPQVFLVVRVKLMQIFSGLVEFTVNSVKVLVEVRPNVRLDACDDNGF
jgi:hypothetical protein